MPVFKITKDECFESWWRSYYEVQADNIDQAADLVKHGDIDPYDSESLPDLMQNPIAVEIFDMDGNILIKE